MCEHGLEAFCDDSEEMPNFKAEMSDLMQGVLSEQVSDFLDQQKYLDSFNVDDFEDEAEAEKVAERASFQFIEKFLDEAGNDWGVRSTEHNYVRETVPGAAQRLEDTVDLYQMVFNQDVKSAEEEAFLETFESEIDLSLRFLANIMPGNEYQALRDTETAQAFLGLRLQHMSPREAFDYSTDLMRDMRRHSDFASDAIKAIYTGLAEVLKSSLYVHLQTLENEDQRDEYTYLLARMFTNRQRHLIPGHVTDSEFSAEILRQELDFTGLAMRYAETTLRRPNPLKEKIATLKSEIGPYVHSWEPPREDLLSLWNSSQVRDDSIAGLSAKMMNLMILQAEKHDRIFLPADIDTFMESEFNPWLEQSLGSFNDWSKQGATGKTAEQVALVTGVSFSGKDHLWGLIKDIQGNGWLDASDETVAIAAEVAKVGVIIAGTIAAGLAVGIATGGSGFLVMAASSATVMGTASAGLNALVYQRGGDNIQEILDIYGKEFAIGAIGGGSGGAIARTAYAGRLLLSLGPKAQNMLLKGLVNGGEALRRTTNLANTNTTLGWRMLYGLGEGVFAGGAGAVADGTAEALIRQEETLAHSLRQSVLNPINLGFVALGLGAEIRPSLLREVNNQGLITQQETLQLINIYEQRSNLFYEIDDLVNDGESIPVQALVSLVATSGNDKAINALDEIVSLGQQERDLVQQLQRRFDKSGAPNDIRIDSRLPQHQRILDSVGTGLNHQQEQILLRSYYQRQGNHNFDYSRSQELMRSVGLSERQIRNFQSQMYLDEMQQFIIEGDGLDFSITPVSIRAAQELPEIRHLLNEAQPLVRSLLIPYIGDEAARAFVMTDYLNESIVRAALYMQGDTSTSQWLRDEFEMIHLVVNMMDADFDVPLPPDAKENIALTLFELTTGFDMDVRYLYNRTEGLDLNESPFRQHSVIIKERLDPSLGLTSAQVNVRLNEFPDLLAEEFPDAPGIRQPHMDENLDLKGQVKQLQLYGSVGHHFFDDALNRVFQGLQRDGLIENTGLSVTNPKRNGRLIQKVVDDYKSDPTRLLDLVRGRLSFSTMDDAYRQLPRVIDDLTAQGLEVVKIKNQAIYLDELNHYPGFRAINVTVRQPVGDRWVMGEIQITSERLNQANIFEHEVYEVRRLMQSLAPAEATRGQMMLQLFDFSQVAGMSDEQFNNLLGRLDRAIEKGPDNLNRYYAESGLLREEMMTVEFSMPGSSGLFLEAARYFRDLLIRARSGEEISAQDIDGLLRQQNELNQLSARIFQYGWQNETSHFN